ncbi:MAG: ThiF family adenylyltransferase [Bacteroidaceae bacterium]
MTDSSLMLFDRVVKVVGNDAFSAFASVRVVVFGVGGVGSWCAEALVRSGFCRLTLVDPDCVVESNVNRQLEATVGTLGMPKVVALKEHLLSVNPKAEIVAVHDFYDAANRGKFDLSKYDFVVDAIDSLKDKAALIVEATRVEGCTLFSSMGAAMKIDCLQVATSEFWKVEGCPLARALRKRFKCEGVFPMRKFMCVYSREKPIEGAFYADGNGSMVHVTAVFGFTLAQMVMKKVIELTKRK